MSKRSRLWDRSDLPDDDGHVFVAHNGTLGVLGRRYKGRLYPGQVFKLAAAARRPEDCPGAEIIVGEEAEELLAAIRAEEMSRRPLWIFERDREVEKVAGFGLAGTLSLPRKKFRKKVNDILNQLAARVDVIEEIAVRWDDNGAGGVPFCSDEIMNSKPIMSVWFDRCVHIHVRFAEEMPLDQRDQQEMMMKDPGFWPYMGIAEDGSRLN
jgi:hypothetical protein